MARTSTYLNFTRNTLEAFEFYKKVFGTDFEGPISYMGDVPPQEGQPELAEEDKKLIMHIQLPILGGHVLMGTDSPSSMGFNLIQGNNIYLNLEPDTRAETKNLFDALSEGGKVQMQLQEMFWGGFYGSVVDKFGIQWMFNCSAKE